ncbi:hypothetical protein TTHERM_00125400 (macronuclear) [Tetrahymena thermophila SB210]|uniref:Uncharacterized protein n=1 Tax=Tetrahymena thermophila (strain SB210) TaxID=312017 RepID=I7M1A9_TETTS|nr:hypothetical protein TTHERM_00125400 [Tetrahymena thermophila SB210]EAR95974.2 hypothetical protein TTHERM_00125400 [Tetrahymena thermophila SB210]|eukprot:XP_001016219.2 hypothetical protein TTHERM_00125400 [Tetrahymena thermophila SB210]
MYQPLLYYNQINQVNRVPQQYVCYVPQNQYLQMNQNPLQIFPNLPQHGVQNQIIVPIPSQIPYLQQTIDINAADLHETAGISLYSNNSETFQQQNSINNEQKNPFCINQIHVSNIQESKSEGLDPNNKQYSLDRLSQYQLKPIDRDIQDNSNTFYNPLELNKNDKTHECKIEDIKNKKIVKQKHQKNDAENKSNIQHKAEDTDCQSNLNIQKQQQSKKNITSWKYIKFDPNNQTTQGLPVIQTLNDTQLQNNSTQQTKFQPSAMQGITIKKECEKIQKNLKVESVKNEEELIEENQQTESKISGTNQQENKNEEASINGNLCKNLMRAFNKFVKDYDFKDVSIKISLFRFLERNTYSNLQMLKIYHNERYRSIFLEFVKGGALIWLQKSKVIDIDAHITLLEKIVSGDISMIGIKKRKNVSKTITKNIKRKRLSSKKM